MELNGQHRYIQDPEWGRILSQLRNVTPTASDIEAINCNVHDKDDNLPSDIKYVMYTNKDRDIIIMSIFIHQIKHSSIEYHHTNDFVLMFCDNVMVRKAGTFYPLTQKSTFYETSIEPDIGNESRSRIDPVLKVVLWL
jgi:hypothetical protein